jgi:hypothetical protein
MLATILDLIGFKPRLEPINRRSNEESKARWDHIPRDMVMMIADYLCYTAPLESLRSLQKLRSLNTHWRRTIDHIFVVQNQWSYSHERDTLNDIMTRFIATQQIRTVYHNESNSAGTEKLTKHAYKVRLMGYNLNKSPIWYSQVPIIIHNTGIRLTYISGQIQVQFQYTRRMKNQDTTKMKKPPKFKHNVLITIDFDSDINHPYVKRDHEPYFNPNIPQISSWTERGAKFSYNSLPEYKKSIANNIISGLKWILT